MTARRTLFVRASVITLPLAAVAVWALAPANASSSVAAWHMNEPAGASTMVDSAGGHNGTLHNVQSGQPGSSGSGYRFNGSSSVVVVPPSAAFSPGNADWSFTVHISFTEVPSKAVGDYDLLRGPSQGAYKSEILATHNRTIGQASCFFKGSRTKATVTAGPNLADGRWHTVTCTKRATTVQLTVDGASFSKTVAVGTLTNNGPVALGGKATGGDWFKGLMDEVSVTSG